MVSLNSFLNMFVYFLYSETSEKRNKDTNLNYLVNNSLTLFIVLFISLALYMNIQKYELRFYLFIHFQLLKFRMFDTELE